MKRPKQKVRAYTWALAVFCFLLILLAAPLLVSDRYNRIALQTGAVLAASNNSYSLVTPVRLMTGPTIELERGTLSVPPNRTGLARGGQMIAMLITGNGPQLTLEHATFTADFSAREPTFSREAPDEEVAPLVKALQGLQFDGLVVRESTVRIKMSDGSLLQLDKVSAAITSKPNGAIHATGSFDFRNETVTFDTTLGASRDAQGMSRALNASFKSQPISANLDGNLLLGENPQLIAPRATLQTPNLRAMTNWLGIEWPEGNGFGPFRAKGQMEWNGRSISLQNAELELDDNSATGTLSLNYAPERPMVEGTLGFKTLNVAQYLKSDDPAAKQDNMLAAIRNASGLEFPLIQAIDADFRISAGSLSLPTLSVGRSAATVSLRQGKMLADIAELEFEDGTRGSGQIRIDMAGANPHYGLQVKFEAADVSHAIRAVFGHPAVQGRGALTADLTASGNTGDMLLRSLAGKLSVTLAEAGRIGLDINKLTATDSEPLDTAAWQNASTRAITVDKLDARFTVAKGILRAQSAEAVSGERALKAEGAIDLIDRDLDLEFAVSDAPKATSSAGSIETGSVITPGSPRNTIGVHGPWAAPTVRSGISAGEAPTYGPPSPG